MRTDHPLPESFPSYLSSRRLHTYSHLCHEAMNCSPPCGLNTVDISYFDKCETTYIDSSQDSAPDNLRRFHSQYWKLRTDRICRMLCFFLLLWRIEGWWVDWWSLTHWHKIVWWKLWLLDYEIETCIGYTVKRAAALSAVSEARPSTCTSVHILTTVKHATWFTNTRAYAGWDSSSRENWKFLCA